MESSLAAGLAATGIDRYPTASVDEVTARLDLDRKQLELRIAESVKRLNGEVGKAERIARHRVLDREFSQDAGELTATLKLRRRSCAERFAVEIDQLYADRLAGA